MSPPVDTFVRRIKQPHIKGACTHISAKFFTMGSRRAPEGSLPKADAIGDDALYELKTLEAPVLRGLPLWLFSLITRTPLWGPLWASLTWKSGLPQVRT